MEGKLSNQKSISTIILLVVAAFVLQCATSQTQRDLSHIELPEGFKIEVFADKIPLARQIVSSPSGTVFVGTRGDKVYALKDLNGDMKPDKIIVLASGLHYPNGVALRNGNLYVAQINRILRFDDIQNNLDNPKYVVVKDDLPTDTWHGLKFIAFGPDGKLYIAIGGPCNVCNKGDPYATINRMNSDGSEFEIFARGVRNTVGFDWDPRTGLMWFTDNGRDQMGDDIPADQLNMAPTSGLHFGFPYCHGGDVQDPQFTQRSCSQFVPPKVKLQAHVANLGVDFYIGSQFPAKYRNGMFIALHGSWDRSSKVGYKVIFVKFVGDTLFYNQNFASGWLVNNSTVTGRPVDVEQYFDSSILVTDDQEGLVYRISYSPTNPTEQSNWEFGAAAAGLSIIAVSVLLIVRKLLN